MKKIKAILGAFLMLAMVSTVFTPKSNTTVEAQSFAGSIYPYFSAYIADAANGSISGQSDIFDLTAYTGAFRETAKVYSEYQISHTEATKITYPLIATLEELDAISITLNNVTVEPTIQYGETPFYQAGESIDNSFFFQNVESSELEDGEGVMYVFENITSPLSISFSLNEGQSVFFTKCNSQKYANGVYTISSTATDEFPCTVFATDGELLSFQSDNVYTQKTMTYSEYIDYYTQDLIDELGWKRIRDYVCSQFNRYRNNNVCSINDLWGDFDGKILCMMSIDVPQTQTGQSILKINSIAEPMKNAYFDPTIYMIRSVMLQEKEYPYRAEIKLPSNIPYIIESTYSYENGIYEASKAAADSYFVFSSEQKPIEKTYGTPSEKNNDWILYVCIAVGVLGVATLVIIFVGLKSAKKSGK